MTPEHPGAVCTGRAVVTLRTHRVR
jgi:hypothetical protein